MMDIKVIDSGYGQTAWIITDTEAYPFSLEYDTIESASDMIDGLLLDETYTSYGSYPIEDFTRIMEKDGWITFHQWVSKMESAEERED